MATVRWGQAKREVKALWPLISKRLAETTIRQIYLELKDTGQVTSCQSKFYAQVNRLKANTPTSQPTGRDLVALAASAPPVTVSVNRPIVPRPASSVEPGPTATIDRSPHAKDAEDYF